VYDDIVQAHRAHLFHAPVPEGTASMAAASPLCRLRPYRCHAAAIAIGAVGELQSSCPAPFLGWVLSWSSIHYFSFSVQGTKPFSGLAKRKMSAWFSDCWSSALNPVPQEFFWLQALRVSSYIELTNWVVLEHLHGERCPGAREGVEEASHGHRNEAHNDSAGLGYTKAR